MPFPLGILASSKRNGGFRASVMADSPLAFWWLDDTVLSNFNDSSGNARHLGLSASTGGMAAPLTAESLYSWNAPGSTYAAISRATWQESAAFTIEAIIRPDDVGSYKAIFSFDASSPRGWSFYVNGGTLLMYDFNTGTTADNGSIPINVGISYHVAVAYASGSFSLYVNGVLDRTVAKSLTTNPAHTNGFVLGASYAGGGAPQLNFDGRIDEVAFYGSKLSTARILAHAQAAGF